jgi:hypothetical protein
MSLAEDILSVLDDPTYMWSHALRESSQDSQRLFLTLPLLPQPISTDDLQIAYSSQRFNQTEPFLDSLRALEDSFISIDAGYEDQRWVNFRNPSLQDFSHEYLNMYSDWFDRLLSGPVFYEQIASTYNLARTRHPGQRKLSPKPPPRWIYHEGALKFTGIRSWVISRHEGLIAKAADLALSGSEIRVKYQDDKQVLSERLRELVSIMLVFGEPADPATKQSLSKIIHMALKPSSKSSATNMVTLLRIRNTGDLIERYSTNNAMATLRANVLDKDTWKFPILSLIDEFLEIDSRESMAAWGDDYVDYLYDFMEEMSYSTDYEDFDYGIRELENISSFLGIDLHQQIETLENQRDALPSQEDDEDYEDYDSKDDSRSSSRELDNVFASLLE